MYSKAFSAGLFLQNGNCRPFQSALTSIEFFHYGTSRTKFCTVSIKNVCASNVME